MRISDWSSDVCSSDLLGPAAHAHTRTAKIKIRIDADGQTRSLSQLFRQSKRTIRFRSEEHTSELQSLMRISYAVFCLKKKKELESAPERTLRESDSKKKAHRITNTYTNETT